MNSKIIRWKLEIDTKITNINYNIHYNIVNQVSYDLNRLITNSFHTYPTGQLYL